MEDDGIYCLVREHWLYTIGCTQLFTVHYGIHCVICQLHAQFGYLSVLINTEILIIIIILSSGKGKRVFTTLVKRKMLVPYEIRLM